MWLWIWVRRTVLGMGLLFLAACSPPVEPQTAPPKGKLAEIGATTDIQSREPAVPVTYAGQVKAIIESRCAPCHMPGGYMYGAHPFDSYAGVKSRADRIRERVYVLRNMPFMGFMPDEERELIARWVDAGTSR